MAASTKLIIVESPAKARTIAKFLGRGYKVEASQGHVRDLPKSQLGVDPDKDFEMKYITIHGRGKILTKSRKEAKSASRIYLATDPDREGEAISWHLAQTLDIDPASPCRIEFHEITQKAVQNALHNPRPIDMERVDAQQARRALDRLVGYKISPLLWAKVKKGLSAGRVQSVATRLVVEREQDIEDFIPEEYWEVTANALLPSARGRKTTFTLKLSPGAGRPPSCCAFPPSTGRRPSCTTSRRRRTPCAGWKTPISRCTASRRGKSTSCPPRPSPPPPSSRKRAAS